MMRGGRIHCCGERSRCVASRPKCLTYTKAVARLQFKQNSLCLVQTAQKAGSPCREQWMRKVRINGLQLSGTSRDMAMDRGHDGMQDYFNEQFCLIRKPCNRAPPCAVCPTPSLSLAEALGEATSRWSIRQLQQHLHKPWVRLPICGRYFHLVTKQCHAIAAGPRLALL